MDPGYVKMITYSYEDFQRIWTGVLILFAKNDDFREHNEKTSTFNRFWQLIQPNKIILIQALFGAIVFTTLGLAM